VFLELQTATTCTVRRRGPAAFGVVTSTTIRFLQMSLEDVATSADLMVAAINVRDARIFVGVNDLR